MIPGSTPGRRTFYASAGFRPGMRLHRMLRLAGHDLRLVGAQGWPGKADAVIVWGHARTARRGEALAARSGAALIRAEDAFLRSLRPGRAGEPPLGLVLDARGTHFDARQPSDLERLLASHALDDTALLDRARDAAARIAEAQLSKYSATEDDAPVPHPGFVLVIDQTRGDASIALGGGSAATFREMLVFAREEHPGAKIVIKTHPETAQGHRAGHYGPGDTGPGISLYSGPAPPRRLFENARAVYTVSSQAGFEAIFAGHRPVVFGQPFYAGWGLTDDRAPLDRRQRVLTRSQLFAAAMILYPCWYDPYRDRLGTIEDALGALEARVRAWREDRRGHVAVGMRLWKRRPLQAVFGAEGPALRFAEAPEAAVAPGRPVMVWAGVETPALARACDAAGLPLARLEDGFVRSRGLGAALTPALSLVRDEIGIYYDPTRPSGIEAAIAAAAELPPARLDRAERLIARLICTGLSKYNLGSSADLPGSGGRPVIVVPGQVEDDASIRLGAGAVRTNLGLLQAARAEHPGAMLIYKPHPDVEAGLRAGAVPPAALARLADHVARRADPAALIDHADRIVTMTSLMGFEALVRSVPVTTFGTPFYAGWGLTDDRGGSPARRRARPSLAALVHATLIAYPRYHDPVTGRPCPVEVAMERLVASRGLPGPPGLRALSRLQGRLASAAWLWRR